MNYFDILIIVILLWGAWKGFSNGFIISVASFIAIILGIWGAVKFCDFSAFFINNHFSISSKYLKIIGFAITFIIIIILVHILAKLIDKLLTAVALGLVNKLAGAAFGILKYCMIIGVFLVIFNNLDKKFQILPEKFKNESLFYKNLAYYSLKFYPYLENYFNDGMKNLNHNVKIPESISQPRKK